MFTKEMVVQRRKRVLRIQQEYYQEMERRKALELTKDDPNTDVIELTVPKKKKPVPKKQITKAKKARKKKDK